LPEENAPPNADKANLPPRNQAVEIPQGNAKQRVRLLAAH